MAVEARYRIEDKAVAAAIRRVLTHIPIGGDGRPVFALVGGIVKADTQLRFRSQQTPAGVAWKPSQRVLREGGQTLSLTRRLRNSITYFADHASVEIGTNVVYARRMQQGYPGGPGRGHARTPAREYLGVSEAGKSSIVTSVGAFLVKQWGV